MPRPIHRRDFLKASAATASALALPGIGQAAHSTRRVIVVGAGLAGVSAAYELAAAGVDVTVVEARKEAGGRVRTLRSPFSTGVYAEMGAQHAHAAHVRLAAWCDRLGLEMAKRARSFDSMLELHGERFRSGPGADFPVALTPSERGLSAADLWQRYVEADVASAFNADGDSLDALTVPDYLRGKGASAGAREILTAGESVDGESARSWLLREGPRRSPERRSIRGGNDLLPSLLAELLGERVLYDAAVVAISQGANEVNVTVQRGAETQVLTADRVVMTAPPTTYAKLRFERPLSAQKRAAVAELHSPDLMRFALESRSRWAFNGLETEGAIGGSRLRVCDATFNQFGPRCIAVLDAEGDDAEQLRVADRVERALNHVERLFPGYGADFDNSQSLDWGNEPWAAPTPRFTPGQLGRVVPTLARAEGRIHFAGDHTSPWAATMEGALESGERATREVLNT
jgi:monoamine oxidase